MIKIDKNGLIPSGEDYMSVLVALAQDNAKAALAAVTDLTNNSGGTAAAEVLGVDTAFVNAADVATSLAQEAASQTALATVKDALMEIAAKANTVAGVLGITPLTNSIGGTAADGTVGAVTVAVTAAATGVQATELNVIRVAINQRIKTLTMFVNRLAEASGIAVVDHVAIDGEYTQTLAALAHTVTGTAADPGVTKVALDAALVLWRNDVKTLAEKLNVIVGPFSVPNVVATA